MQISPAILAKNKLEFQEKVERVRPLGLPLHVDVMDGSFVPEVTWADPIKVEQIVGDLDFEVHLMVADPEHTAIVWLATSAKRVWFHVEATKRGDMIVRAAMDNAKRLGLVINPETPISHVTPFLDLVPSVLVMGVTPGASGQPFQDIALEKVEQLKRLRPNLWVKVDGGVSPENVARIREAGADEVASASALTENPDISLAYARFKQALNGPASTDKPAEAPKTPEAPAEAPAVSPETEAPAATEGAVSEQAAKAAPDRPAEKAAESAPAEPVKKTPEKPPSEPEPPENTKNQKPAESTGPNDPEAADIDIFNSPSSPEEKPNP